MTSANLTPAPDALSAESCKFLSQLMREYGVKKRTEWTNYNKTTGQTGYVLDLPNLTSAPADIFRRVFEHNKTCEGRPIRVVPVAGWKERSPLPNWMNSLLGIAFKRFRNIRWLREFSQSFSLSTLTTAKDADVILRVQRAAQKMELIQIDGRDCITVTPGVRITDADKFLSDRGFALPPNMPTLHVGSIVGTAANGCYGPARDHGSMTTNIAEMKMVTPLGKQLTLSEAENADLFYALKDFHMGAAGFVSELTLKNIEPNFLMQRQDVVCHDIAELRDILETNPMEEHEHFLAMYIPVGINDGDDHAPRIRTTTFDRVTDPDAQITKKNYRSDSKEYKKYLRAELGEPFIDIVVDCEKLQKAFPSVLNLAARTTYGKEKTSEAVGWAADIAHVFSSYTDSPIHDVNWLIQTDSPADAQALLADLLELVEQKLKRFASDERHPLFNAFSRYLKGVHYEDGANHGPAPTAVEHAGQGVLSFELLTYTALASTPEFKELQEAVIEHLHANGHKYNWHPGKHFPESIHSVKELFDPDIRKRGLDTFRAAIAELHGGSDNLAYSPLLPPEKRAFLYGENSQGSVNG